MAIQIPDAPNIIGSEPVLRSPDQVNGTTLTPQFKVDSKAEREVVGAMGDLLADVNQTRIDTYMTQASLWWTENMNKRIREITDPVTGIKGKNAMDLYVTQIRPYAKQLTDELTGAPKNDGVVRIANPQLQTAFKKWVDGQLPNYNAQIARYEGQELAKWNESTFDAREEQITNGLLNATTEPEIVGYSQSMLDLNRVRYRGYNPDRITQLAAAKVDAAVASNIKAQITNDVEAGRTAFLKPQVQGVLSSKSKAEIQQLITKQYVGQTSARGGEELASGSNEKLRAMTSDENMRLYLFTDDPIKIEATRKEIYSNAKTRSDALTEKSVGVREQIAANLGTELSNAQTEDELLAVHQKIAEFDPRWADQIARARDRDGADALTVLKYNTLGMVSDYDTRASTIQSEIENKLTDAFSRTNEITGHPEGMMQALKDIGAGSNVFGEVSVDNETAAMMSTVKDMELAGTPRAEAISIVAADAAQSRVGFGGMTPEQQKVVEDYNTLKGRLAEQSKLYTEIQNDIISGITVNGYDPRMDKLTTKQQQSLQASAAIEQEYRRLIDSHPGTDSVFKDLDSRFPQLDIGFRNRAKKFAMKRIGDWERTNGRVAAGEQFNQLAMQGYEDARDPAYNAMEAAVYGINAQTNLGTDNAYWGRETRTDIMAQGEYDKEILEASKYLGEPKVIKDVSDRELDYYRKTAREKIKDYRNHLPKDMRPAVDANMDMYIEWYIRGATSYILENTRQWYDLNRRW